MRGSLIVAGETCASRTQTKPEASCRAPCMLIAIGSSLHPGFRFAHPANSTKPTVVAVLAGTFWLASALITARFNDLSSAHARLWLLRRVSLSLSQGLGPVASGSMRFLPPRWELLFRRGDFGESLILGGV